MKIFFGLAARGNQEEEVNNNRKTIKRKKKKYIYRLQLILNISIGPEFHDQCIPSFPINYFLWPLITIANNNSDFNCQ